MMFDTFEFSTLASARWLSMVSVICCRRNVIQVMRGYAIHGGGGGGGEGGGGGGAC